MKRKLTGQLWAKLLALFLLLLSMMTALASGVSVVYGDNEGFYAGSCKSYFDTSDCRWRVTNAAYNMAGACTDYMTAEGQTQIEAISERDISQILAGWYPAGESNLGMQVLSAAGEVTAQSNVPENIGFEATVTAGEYTVRAVLAQEITVQDQFYTPYRVFGFLFPLRYTAITVFAVSFLIALVLIAFLCCAAGHKERSDEIVLNWQDRIPLDLYGGLYIGLATLAALMADDVFNSDVGSVTAVMVLVLDLMVFTTASIALLLTCATRLKYGKWWRNTLIYRVSGVLWQGISALWRAVSGMVRGIPLFWRTLCIMGAVFLVSIICWEDGGLWVMFYLLLTTAVCGGVLQLRKLQKAGELLASGDLETKVDTRKMFWDFKRHGDNLNSIGQGMSIAVDQRLRSERLKTELITNVSHDIKTPLTSIINYVDLLQKAETEEQRREYLFVLDRQAHRLKKLTEDLVEASKASTGNMSVTLVPTNLGELVQQAVGEYSERLSQGGLEVVTLTPEGTSVLADGKLLWRVLDNLLGNVCKYAQSGTRVYIEAKPGELETMLSVKNISRAALNIDPEELMERFVRGDASRNTEGSGLGLNIARSLVELQKGSFAIRVDGDLFKAEVTLRSVQKLEKAPQELPLTEIAE